MQSRDPEIKPEMKDEYEKKVESKWWLYKRLLSGTTRASWSDNDEFFNNSSGIYDYILNTLVTFALSLKNLINIDWSSFLKKYQWNFKLLVSVGPFICNFNFLTQVKNDC